MKKLFWIASILILSCVVFSQDKVADLGWMAGCWRMTGGKSVTDEQWMKPSGGMMLGMSRTVTDGKAEWYENTRFVEKDGSVFFVARPSSAKDDAFFKLKTKTPTQWTFENLEHDFPQRIIYRLNGTMMTGSIEGTMNGKPKRIDFPFKRVKCG